MRTSATSATERREGRRGSSAADTFLRWPIIVAVALPVIPFILLETPAAEFFFFGYGAYLLFALLLAWVAAGAVGAFIAIQAARRGAWRRAVSAGLAPLLVFAPLLYFENAWSLGEEAADLAHFYIMRGAYLARVAELPDEHGPRVALFYWRGMMLDAYGVLYDESDEIMRPPEQRSAAWQVRFEDQAGCAIGRVSPITDHIHFARPLGEPFLFCENLLVPGLLTSPSQVLPTKAKWAYRLGAVRPALRL